jgi:hypothetical protein
MQTDNKTSHLKNIINNIIIVKAKTANRDHLFLNILVAQCYPIQFRHAGLAAKDKLLNQHLNATIHEYTDTTYLLDKGRRSRK